jgi:hypothetical protein
LFSNLTFKASVLIPAIVFPAPPIFAVSFLKETLLLHKGRMM